MLNINKLVIKDNNLPYTKLYNTMRYNKPSRDGWMVKIID